MSRLSNLPQLVAYQKTLIAGGTPEPVMPHISGTTIAFNNANPDTITDSGSNFIKKGFQPEMTVTVTGATNSANNNTFTVDTVVAGTLTLSTDAVLTAESAGATVTIQCVYPVPDGIEIVLKAKDANAGIIYYANSSAKADKNSGSPGNGFNNTLKNNESIKLQMDNLSRLWYDGTTGEGIEVCFEA